MQSIQFMTLGDLGPTFQEINDGFASECELLKLYAEHSRDPIQSNFSDIAFQHLKTFYELTKDQQTLVKYPIQSKKLEDHINEKVLEFLNTLDFKKATKQSKSKEKSEEIAIVDPVKIYKLKPWLAKNKELIDLAHFLGYKKFSQTIAAVIAVYLYKPRNEYPQLKSENQLMKKYSHEEEYDSITFHNVQYQEVQKEFDQVSERARNQRNFALGGFGFAVVNDIQLLHDQANQQQLQQREDRVQRQEIVEF